MNTKETLKKLHKKFPLMSLDELFEILDCYTEEFTLSYEHKPWTQPSISWNTVTDKPDLTKYTITTTDGKLKYYDGGSSSQLVAEH